MNLALALLVLSQDPAPALKVGDPAPEFTAKDQDGRDWSSKDVVGKKTVVVYFYPAAFTEGCSHQAVAYQRQKKALDAKGVVVVGVSGDTVRALDAFRKVKRLEFPLLSDEKGELARKFGVPAGPGGDVKWPVDGKLETFTRGATLARWTFVIDPEGRIVQIKSKVDPRKDAQEILALMEGKN